MYNFILNFHFMLYKFEVSLYILLLIPSSHIYFLRMSFKSETSKNVSSFASQNK